MDGQLTELGSQLRVKDLGLISRFNLRFKEGIKVNEDRGEVSSALDALQKQGIGYLKGEEIRGEVKKFIMMILKPDDGEISLVQIPGIHDVNVPTGEEPLNIFLGILEDGYFGGPMMNVFLLDDNYTERFSEVSYEDNLRRGTHVGSMQEETKGDRYRLSLWSGFTANYSTYFPSGPRSYCYATVANCPTEDIRPFILLKDGLSEEEQEKRIEFYQQRLSKLSLPNPVKVMVLGKEATEIKS